MKPMILFDLAVCATMVRQQAISMLIASAIVTLFTGSLLVVVAAVCVSVSISAMSMLASRDDQGGWERFRLALPLSRADVIRGRYASVALATAAGALLGVALTGLFAGVAQALPESALSQMNLSLDSLFFGITPLALAAEAAACVALMLLMAAIILPLVSRFGMTTAVRWLPAVLILAVFLGAMALGDQSVEISLWLEKTLSTPESMALASLAILAAACALYAISCAAARKLYHAREF